MILAISAKAAGGKTTLINGLRSQITGTDIYELNFADALKSLVLFAFIPKEWNLNLSDLADQDIKLRKTPSGKTIRQLLQIIGTDQFRKLEAGIWIRLYKQTYNSLSKNLAMPKYPLTFTADLRFPDELKTIHELGGIAIRLLRNPNQNACKHESETALDFTTEATEYQYNKLDSWWTIGCRVIKKVFTGDFTHYWKFKRWNGEKFDLLIDNRDHTIEQTTVMVMNLLRTQFQWTGI